MDPGVKQYYRIVYFILDIGYSIDGDSIAYSILCSFYISIISY